jgi:hypothetical protein
MGANCTMHCTWVTTYTYMDVLCDLIRLLRVTGELTVKHVYTLSVNVLQIIVAHLHHIATHKQISTSYFTDHM